MKGRVLLSVLMLALACCSRPSSREYFVMRENAGYGDTYSFTLDLSDTLLTYELDFFTRLERIPFEDFRDDDIILDLRWFSPADSILTDTLVVSISEPVGSDFFSKDIVTPYDIGGLLDDPGEWRLNAKVVNDSESIRGLGLILNQRKWDTTN